MTPPAQTLCLCMIVKDEAPVIQRCLASVRPLIHHWIVVDTGSSDGTQAIVRAAMAGLPGELVERPWVDFAHNRSEALALARPHADYTLIIDADDALEIPDGFAMPPLSAGSYALRILDAEITYSRTQIVRNALPWRYEGVLHEYLTCEGAPDGGSVEGLAMRRNHDGARRRDPRTYHRDADLLERALTRETSPFLVSRYRFYLAQSYRDCGMKEKALENYLARAELGFWIEEVFVALLNAARLREDLGHAEAEVLAAYERASSAVPTRAEALHGAARFCRVRGRNAEGFAYAARGLAIQKPSEGLFLETWIYEYGLLDELAVTGYWAGRYDECLKACQKLLAKRELPDEQRARVEANAVFAQSKLNESACSPDMSRPVEILVPDDLAAPRVTRKRYASAVGRYESRPFVSIITPTCGRDAFLVRSLSYVLSQDYLDFEWLILDDSDFPSDIFSSLRHEKIFYEYSKEKKSIGEKRNLLVERSRGSIIIHVDDDDFYCSTYISLMIKKMIEMDVDILNIRGFFLFDCRSNFFGYNILNSSGGLRFVCDGGLVGHHLFDDSGPNSLDKHTHLGYGFAYAYKRIVWERSHFRNISWYEDTQFILDASNHFKIAGFEDRNGICLHFLHENSSSKCLPQYMIPKGLAGIINPDFNLAIDISLKLSKKERSTENLCRLSTWLGWRVYFDAKTSSLRHGPAATVPDNLRMAISGEKCSLILQYDNADSNTPQKYVSLDGSLAVQSCEKGGSEFELLPVPVCGLYAFRKNGRYLCAEEHSGVALSRIEAARWEHFALVSADNAEAAKAVTLVITSCNRLSLLRTTIESFVAYNTYPIFECIIVEDGGANLEAAAVADLIPADVTIIINEENIGQIKSIDRAYANVKTPYIFHCEDDWEFIRAGFIEVSLEILEKDQKVSNVWLRAHDDTQGHPIEYGSGGSNYSYMTLGYRAAWGIWNGFSLNPGLRRTSDYMRFRPYHKLKPVVEKNGQWELGEEDLSAYYYDAGFRGAITDVSKGFVRHIGWSAHIPLPWEK